MSDDEINEDICKFIGWKFSDHPDHIAKTASWKTAESFAIKPDGEFVFKCNIPRFTDSLNLIHEVEKVIAEMGVNKWWEYVGNLLRHNPTPFGAETAVHASARQRAEAFLRTIGKWKEEAK